MKKCVKCGREIADDVNFCNYCGTQQPVVNPTVEPVYQDNRNKKIIVLVVAAVAAFAAILIVYNVVRNMPVTIDLDKYMTLSYSGYDTNGSLSADFDYDSMRQAISDAMIEKHTATAYNLSNNLDNIFSGFTYEADKYYDLSNGDKIKITYNYNDNYAKLYKIRFKQSKKTYTVEGLEEIDTFDAFKNVQVMTDGIAPYGSAQVVCNDDNHLSYYVEPSTGLSNGDKITVYTTYSYEDNFSTYGELYREIPSSSSKEYQVSGLNTYVTKLKDIPDAIIDRMDEEAQNHLKSYDWDNDESLGKIELLGEYFLKAREDEYTDTYNKVYLIYKVGYSNDSGTSTNYYYWMEGDGIYQDKDGDNVTYSGDPYFPRKYLKVDDDHRVIGYETLNEVFEYCVTDNMSSYTYESTVTQSGADASDDTTSN